jgi:hypothetical protein
MKKILLYSIGGLIIVLLIGFWVYSFLYGSPNNDTPTFASFDFFGGEAAAPVESMPAPTTETPRVDVAGAKLRQLTTKPVLGAQVINIGQAGTIRYVEAGTGHVFDINLDSGTEERVSQVSIPVASEAVVSQSGEYVAVRSGYTDNNEVVVIHIPRTGTPSRQTLPANITSFAFGLNDVLYFAQVSGATLLGKSYRPQTLETSQLFTVPFTAATILWSDNASTSHFVITKPAATLTSYLYEVKAGNLVRLPLFGQGLLVVPHHKNLLWSMTSENGITMGMLDTETQNPSTLSVPTLVSKCVFSQGGTIYCGADLEIGQKRNLPDAWFKGQTSFTDRLWSIDTEKVSTQIANPLTLSGRTIDVMSPELSPDEKMLYFINKMDSSLWLYEL